MLFSGVSKTIGGKSPQTRSHHETRNASAGEIMGLGDLAWHDRFNSAKSTFRRMRTIALSMVILSPATGFALKRHQGARASAHEFFERWITLSTG